MKIEFNELIVIINNNNYTFFTEKWDTNNLCYKLI
jgi:hypothetical protein